MSAQSVGSAGYKLAFSTRLTALRKEEVHALSGCQLSSLQLVRQFVHCQMNAPQNGWGTQKKAAPWLIETDV